MSKLVHVNKIEMVRCEELIPMVILSDTSCRMLRELDFINLDIQELVGVTVEDNYENNEKVFTTTATFTTKCKKPLTDRRMAFRLTGVNGWKYMIGTNQRPYPVIKETNEFPEKPADSTLKAVKVIWKSPYPMLRIV